MSRELAKKFQKEVFNLVDEFIKDPKGTVAKVNSIGGLIKVGFFQGVIAWLAEELQLTGFDVAGSLELVKYQYLRMLEGMFHEAESFEPS
jgi:hypothetical protein